MNNIVPVGLKKYAAQVAKLRRQIPQAATVEQVVKLLATADALIE